MRRYTTQPEPMKKFPTGPIYAVVAAAAVGGTYFLYEKTKPPTKIASTTKSALAPSGNKAFKGGDQGFIDLKLENVEEVNHNTKRFRFALPDKDDVSGLETACA